MPIRSVQLLSILLLLCFTIRAQKSFELSGNITGGYKGKIFLSYGTKKDSAVLSPENNFHFRGEITDSLQGALFLGGTSTIGWIYLEPSTMRVQASFREETSEGRKINIINIDSVSGSHSEAMRRSLSATLKNIRESVDADTIKQQKIYGAIRPFVEAHPRHRLAAFFTASRSLSFDQINSLYRLLDSSLYETQDVSIVVRLLDQKRAIKPGSPLMEIRMPDSSGRFISTKDLDHQLVLVEFWASWCGPCIAQIPDIKKLYSKYHSSGLEIMGVSLDIDRKSWINSMRKLNMSWPNISELTGWDSPVVKQLSIFSIPFNVLVEKGTVVAVNLTPEVLEVKLNDILLSKRDASLLKTTE